MTEATEATPEEWEEFNRMERESRAKQESIRAIKRPTREQLVEELDMAQMLIRELGDRLARIEAGNMRNDVIEEVAKEIEKFTAFGQDTVQSFAVYIRGMKT